MEDFMGTKKSAAKSGALTQKEALEKLTRNLAKNPLDIATRIRLNREKVEKKESVVKKVGDCRVCAGPIVRESRREYHGDPMQVIIGPGYQNQLTTVTVLYCRDCGIRYHKLPKKQK